MEELHFTGNCLKGSRPILSFDATFDTQPHLRLMKELFSQIFGVPKGARKSKPFIDHIMGFTLADGKVWIRCYQINQTEPGKTTNGTEEISKTASKSKSKDTNISLVEIGPRFVMTPIVILESSFGGPVIYENKEFVSPNQIRSDLRTKRAGKYNRRNEQAVERTARKRDLGLRSKGGRIKEKDELDESVLFA
jgi:ribosome biogenesis protein BRX1